MNKICILGGIMITNAYTFLFTIIYVKSNYVLIPNKDYYLKRDQKL
jgi:hypothetical protein